MKFENSPKKASNIAKFIPSNRKTMDTSNLHIKYKLWISKEDGKDVLGKGGAKLLESIDELRDLGKATERMNCSYKHAWNILDKIKKRYGESPVITHRGGSGGGGGIELSDFGRKLLIYYKKCEKYIDEAIKKVESELIEIDHEKLSDK